VSRLTLGEIAARVGGTLEGDPRTTIDGVQPLDTAGPEHLSFLTHPRYRDAAVLSRAAAFLVRPDERLEGRNLIRVENPYGALAAVMVLFHPAEVPDGEVSPLASVDPRARLGRGVTAAPFVRIEADCVIGDRVVLMAGVVARRGASVGEDSFLHPGVVLYAGVQIGSRVVLHAGAVIGSDGFGFGEEAGGRAKIPQIGNVRIEDDVEIGAGTTIDRATFGSTIVGRGSRIDNLVQIGHNVVVGETSVLVAQSGIAGSTRLGRSVILAGQAGVAGHLTLGDGAIVGAKSAAVQDVPAGAFVVGHPAVDHREWKRAQAALRRLPELLKRVRRLEQALARSRSGRGGARRAARITKRRS
jgi:UDP-3-O-[3-hydroxymyristoyl] glucosamine N-acyltransferase